MSETESNAQFDAFFPYSGQQQPRNFICDDDEAGIIESDSDVSISRNRMIHSSNKGLVSYSVS